MVVNNWRKGRLGVGNEQERRKISDAEDRNENP